MWDGWTLTLSPPWAAKDSYDNALAETVNGLYKAELIHRRAPQKTKEAVELATLARPPQTDGAPRLYPTRRS